MPKISLQILANCIVLLVAGCGGGGSTSVTKTPDQSVQTIPAPLNLEVVNGVLVPPDPGSTKDDTVAGIDVDQNGIRDEIDRWIATKYGLKAQSLDAIRMTARADQKFLMVNARTKDEALQAIFELMDVGGCVGGKLRNDGINATEFFSETTFRANNTRIRIDEYKRVMALAGPIARNVDDSVINCPYP